MKVTLISGGDVEHVLVRGVVVQRRRQTDIAGAAPDGDRQAGGSTDRVDQGSPIHGLTGLAVSTTWITRLNLQSANNNHNRLKACSQHTDRTDPNKLTQLQMRSLVASVSVMSILRTDWLQEN